MNWPENSTHYVALPGNSWWDKHPERTERDFYDGFTHWPRTKNEGFTSKEEEDEFYRAHELDETIPY